MLDTIKKGDFYNSILSWHPDRLSRNMKESGEILDMLDNDLIVDLKFSSYTFNNDTAGKMTLSILFAMAKEFSDKLSDDIKRGIEKQLKRVNIVVLRKEDIINPEMVSTEEILKLLICIPKFGKITPKGELK